MFAPLLYVGAGAAGLYFWNNKEKLSDNNSNNNSGPNYDSNQSQQNPQIQEPRQIQIQLPEQTSSSSPRTSIWWWSGGIGFVICYYYYYTHSTSTKKVIGKVEETAEETQALVVETDENNERRINELNENNELRKEELSAEIRGESRAHFEVLSKQMHVVTQVALETLSAIANGITGDSNEENNEFESNQLIAFTEAAQEESEKYFDNEMYLQTRDMHVNELKAQVGRRMTKKKKVKSGNIQIEDTTTPDGEYVTPGGPDDDDIRDVDFYGTSGSGKDDNSSGSSFMKNVTGLLTKKRIIKK